MAQWSERYKSHQVWQLLQNLGPAIDSAFNREGIDTETLDSLARLKSILSFVGRRLAGADPYLFQSGTFDSLGSSLQTVSQEVQNPSRFNQALAIHGRIPLSKLENLYWPEAPTEG